MLLGPLVPEHPQDLAVDLLISDVLHEPVQTILISKVRDLTLQADERGQGALRLVSAEIIVWPKDDTAKHGIDALRGVSLLERRCRSPQNHPAIHLLRPQMNRCQRVC